MENYFSSSNLSSPNFRLSILVLFLFTILSYAPFLKLVDENDSGFLWGDAAYYALAVKSLVKDHDLNFEKDLNPDEMQFSIDERQLSRSIDGGLVIKHSPVMPVISSPFYVSLGNRGLLIFNILCSILCVLGVYILSQRYTNFRIAFYSAVIFGLGTTILPYTFHYSADVCSAVPAIFGFIAAVSLYPVIAGILFGLSIAIKLSNLPLIICLICGFCFLSNKTNSNTLGKQFTWVIKLFFGFIVGLSPYLISNWKLFGSPFITGYQLTVYLDPVEQILKIADHRNEFNQSILNNIIPMLFNSGKGIISTSPLFLLILAGCFWLKHNKKRNEIFLAIAASLVQFLIIAKYDHWDVSHTGNRYLIPVYLILSPLFAIALSRIDQFFSFISQPPPKDLKTDISDVAT